MSKGKSRDELLRELETTGATRIRGVPEQYVKPLIGCGAFTALGTWLWVVSDDASGVAAGIACVVFFGLIGGGAITARIVTAARAIEIDREGIRTGFGSRVAWKYVTSTQVEFLGPTFVSLRIQNRLGVRTVVPLERFFARLNAMLLDRREDHRTGRWALPLPVDLEVSPSDVYKIVARARRLAADGSPPAERDA